MGGGERVVVTITTVWPCRSTAARSSRSTSRPEVASRAPVGSSANSTAGRVTSARAIATRCCCPPDSSPGRCPARSPSPTSASIAVTAPAAGLRPARRSGNATFCAAVSAGMRLNAWKTKPTRSRRSRVSDLSDSPPRWMPSISTSPEVTRSSPAAQCSSVDLPDPDGPITAVNVPCGMRTSTPSRAATVRSPAPYVRRTARSSTAGPLLVIVMAASQPAGRPRHSHARARVRGIPSTTDRLAGGR